MSSPERIVLVGGMCAGKSTVGRLVAERLGWSLIDFDDEIELSQGRSVAEIFRTRGESYFRKLEAELTTRLAGESEVVLAPGGGWITHAEMVERLRPGSLLVWLKVSPELAWERHRRQATVDRPLLAVEDPLDAMRSILSEREEHYRRADVVIDTDARDPRAVAGAVIALLERRRAGGSTAPPLTTG